MESCARGTPLHAYMRETTMCTNSPPPLRNCFVLRATTTPSLTRGEASPGLMGVENMKKKKNMAWWFVLFYHYLRESRVLPLEGGGGGGGSGHPLVMRFGV